MSKAGKRIIQGAKEVLAFARGEVTEGFVVHEPRGDLARRLSVGDPEKHRHGELDAGRSLGKEIC